jgi:hypothetical protein
MPPDVSDYIARISTGPQTSDVVAEAGASPVNAGGNFNRDAVQPVAAVAALQSSILPKFGSSN